MMGKKAPNQESRAASSSQGDGKASPLKEHPRQEQDIALSNSHRGTGILLFDSSGQFLFMNEEARAQLEKAQVYDDDPNTNAPIPPDIHTLVKDLMAHLAQCTHQKDCESIQLERTYVVSKQRRLLRGLCLPDNPIQKNSRFLVIVESLPQQAEEINPVVQDRYHLTEREQMVVIYLMLGFTNKEIANRLNRSEHTVKEHLKRMMQKTQTTSRTGLLSCMIFPMSERGGSQTTPLPMTPTLPIQPRDRQHLER